jgi:hypothetical protein
MRWRKSYAWFPVLCSDKPLEEDAVVEALAQQLRGADESPHLKNLGKNLNVTPEQFKQFARDAVAKATPTDRAWADFAAAFGCEAAVNTKSDFIQDTAFRTMAGAGHQHFLAFMRNIAKATEDTHLRKALFAPWKYDDPTKTLTLRWDPLDDVRHALRAKDPSGDPDREKRGSVLGANRLAVEGLPLFPTAPLGGRLHTTGFIEKKRDGVFFTWPIWDCPINIDVIRTVLAYAELQENPPNRAAWAHMGIVEVYRSRRITVGKMRNFTPARSVDDRSSGGSSGDMLSAL